MSTVTFKDVPEWSDLNPDCEDINTMRRLEAALDKYIAEAALKWFPKMPQVDAQSVVIKVWLYIDCKVAAMERRLDGAIQHALLYEQEAQKLYERIPPHLRW